MRQVIDGKRYDTETAQLIGEAHGGGYSLRDWHYWEEDLYVTKNGRYFLAGKGGALSRWAESGPGQNESRDGSGIRALDRQEALEWAERYTDAITVEEYFADSIEEA